MVHAAARSSVRDYSALRLRLSDSGKHQRQAVAFTTGEAAMPQNAQSDPAHPPRTDKEPGLTHEEDVPSDGKDEQGEQMIEELGQDKPGPHLADPQAGKE